MSITYLVSKIRLFIQRPGYVLKSLYYIFESLLYKNNILKKEKADLVIFDDVFPHFISGFRNSEYEFYLNHFNNCHIFSTGSSLAAVHEHLGIEKIIREFVEANPHYKGKIHLHNPHKFIKADLAYMIFLDNAFGFLEYIEKKIGRAHV